MHRPTRLTNLAVAALLLGAWPASSQGAHGLPPTGSADVGPVVFLVRHAETRPDGSRDPALSEAGRERAARLAVVLGDAGITAVFTTDYQRTRGTAAPIARRLGLASSPYDPGDLEALARQLRTRTGRVLVVGHSNTTPALVAALGGDPGSPILETEHDRLYVVTLDPDTVRTLLLRY